MNRRPKALPICLAVAAAILFGPAQVNIAFGQEAQLEEIVVTARKREEALQDIPLAITAFTSEELQKRSIQNMRDIALFTPGFNFEDFGGSGGTTPVVRGTTQVSILQSGEQNVSVFFDGVYLPRSYVTDLGFANMERVEVVKGPQSARYGRNAFMGAINYIPRRPGDEWDLQGQVVAGNHSRYDWAGTVSGPIVPGLVSVLAGYDYSEFDGTWKNTHPYADIDFKQGTNDRLGGHERAVASLSLRVTPGDDLVIDLSYYDYDFDREHRAQNFFAELGADSHYLNCGQWNPDVRPAGRPGFGYGGQWWRLYCGELWVDTIPSDPRGYARQLNAQFTRGSVNWAISDSIAVEYIYGQLEADSRTLGYKDLLPGCTFATPPLPGCVFESGPIGDFEVDSHEIRVSWDTGGPLRAAAGYFYTKSRDFYTHNFTTMWPLTAVPTEPVDILDRSAFVVYVPLRNLENRNKTNSPFVEISYSFMDDRARISAEARYSNTDKFEGNQPSPGIDGNLEFAGVTLEDEFSSFTPRITLEYDVSDDRLLFVSVAKGVKLGGFNASSVREEDRTFDEDQNWTYEIGSKNILLDGRLRLNGSLFWIDWSDVQIRAQDPGNPDDLSLSLTANLGDVSSKGFELEAAYALSENLTVSGSAYFGDAKYEEGTFDKRWGELPSVCDDIVCPIDGHVGGNQMQRQSKWQATFGTEWRDELALGFAEEYFIRLDVAYQSRQYADAMNLAWVPERNITNASIGVIGSWYEARLWARNLFDELYVSGASVGVPNRQYNAYLGERRTFGLTLVANFDTFVN